MLLDAQRRAFPARSKPDRPRVFKEPAIVGRQKSASLWFKRSSLTRSLRMSLLACGPTRPPAAEQPPTWWGQRLLPPDSLRRHTDRARRPATRRNAVARTT